MHITIILTCENRHFFVDIIKLIVNDFYRQFCILNEFVIQTWLSRYNFEKNDVKEVKNDDFEGFHLKLYKYGLLMVCINYRTTVS